MNGIVISSEEAKAETRITSSVNTWFVSYKNSSPILGLFQDSVIGIYEMTQTDIKGITKFNAMQICNRASVQHRIDFTQETYTGRDIISLYMPSINFDGKPSFYVPEFAPFMTKTDLYDDINTVVKIRDGKLLSGVLDKASVGQGAEGGIFHTIYREKGAAIANETIWNLLQITNYFLSYIHGCTFGTRDITLSRETRKMIKHETSKIIAESIKIAGQFDNGELIPPVGMTPVEHYEEMQMNALAHGDEFIRPVMQEIDPKTNWAYKFIFSGAKGSKSNLMNLFTSIGSIGIKGKRIMPVLGGRTSIYFPRFDPHPIARGYNPNNFGEGISPITFPFAAAEARYELIEVALSTAVAGTMNRNAVKNLEDIGVSNLRSAVKANRLVQPLYGETGFDPRRLQRIRFPTIKLSTADFGTYQVATKELDSKWHNSHVQARLDGEFKMLLEDRRQYRDIFMKLERAELGNSLLKDTVRMPCHPAYVLATVAKLRTKPDALDAVRTIDLIDEYCASIGYLWMNEIQRRAKVPIPAHIEAAVTLIRILIRSTLCTRRLLEAKVDYDGLCDILARLSETISAALITAGTLCGIIAAQSISEPMTQYLLDAKHRSGLRKTKTDTIMRFSEILGNRPTEKLHSPQMFLVPHEEYNSDRIKTVEIANHIEELSVNRFIQDQDIFVEEYGKPVFPGLEHEAAIITRFTVLNSGEKAPRNLVNWCIRFVFSEEELVLKSMKLKTIYLKLSEISGLWIVYTPQTRGSTQLIMRCYMQSIMFKKSTIEYEQVAAIAERIRYTVIRGIRGITNTNVRTVAVTREAKDGSLEIVKLNVIDCDGSNLSAANENPYIDPYQTTTTSISENKQNKGIEAARNKVASELMVTLKDDANYEHATIYADEMSTAGVLTSIQRSGLGQREINNVMLRATFGSPNGVFEEAAINSQIDALDGVSAKMVMGETPRFGTTYNDVCIDTDMVRVQSKTPEELIALL